MKVLIFSQFFPPEMEPTGFMFDSFARYLGRSTVIERVDVICGFPNFPEGTFYDRGFFEVFRSKTEDEEVQVHNVLVFPSNNKSNALRILNYTSYLIAAVVRGLFIRSPDTVVASSPPIFVGLAGLIIAKLKRAKFALDIRDVWPESAVQMGSLSRGSMLVRILEWLEKKLYTHADVITVATPGMVDLVLGRAPNLRAPVRFIPCGVTIPQDEALREESKSPFELEDHSKFCVLYAGLHGHAQNLTTLVDAAVLLKDRQDIVFYFVGTGPDKERVVEYAKAKGVRNLKFLAPVSRDKIRDYFCFAGCAIVPLRDLDVFKNVFPSKTFELMSYGVPAVVGVGGEIAQLLERSAAGIAVRPEVASEYARAIENLEGDPLLRDQIKANARATAQTEFDYAVVNERYLQLLIECC